MATREDELAKKQVQDAVWTWAGRIVVVITFIILGYAAAWWRYGYGPDGAPSLREQVVKMDARIVDLNNKKVDVDGKLTVVQGRLDSCNKDLQTCRAAQSAH